ncbi:hypothetical protein [Synechococcus sp. LA31]|jgi:hypothetical protein|uniref:hypothetical protein n=1 Tax=Synechococcus sp. LA31 TaxID=2741953 RepID=UPI001BDD29A0|nr:hypothetical protein [Synechococcus sp. LA31]QVV67704.1 hypothetical protein KJJ24_00335 [Synechococcus sp. LA31]
MIPTLLALAFVLPIPLFRPNHRERTDQQEWQQLRLAFEALEIAVIGEHPRCRESNLYGLYVRGSRHVVGSRSAGSYEVAPIRILGVPALVVASPQLHGEQSVVNAQLRLLYANQALCRQAEQLSELLLEHVVNHTRLRSGIELTVPLPHTRSWLWS